MANTGQWSSRLTALEDRLGEIEMIVLEKMKPPSRLGSTFRYLVENIETLEQIVEDWKSREQA
jgi:hypothetical protein